MSISRKQWTFIYFLLFFLALGGCAFFAALARAEESQPFTMNTSPGAVSRVLIPPRGPEKPPVPPVVCPIITCPKPPDPYLNRVYLLAGYGPDGLEVKEAPGTTTVSSLYAPLFGIGYERSGIIWDEVSLGAQVMGGGARASRTFVGAVTLGWGW